MSHFYSPPACPASASASASASVSVSASASLSPSPSASPSPSPPSPTLPPPPRLMFSQNPWGHPQHDFQPFNRSSPSLSPDPDPDPDPDLDPDLDPDPDPNHHLYHLPSHSPISRPPSPLYPPYPHFSNNLPLGYGSSPDYPLRPFADHARHSAATWNTASDSELTRTGNESPWMHSTGSVALLDKYDDREAEGMGLFHSPSKAPQQLEKNGPALKLSTTPRQDRRRRIMIAVVVLIFVLLAVIVGAVVSLRRTRNAGLAGSPSSDGTAVTAAGQVAKLWGANGDKITTENGTSFIYKNPLGGTWVAIPFNDSAKCQDDSPPLSQPWDYAHRRIFGVNLGGWLVLEPFITPYLFEPFNPDEAAGSTPPTVVDEWTLSSALGNKLASTLEHHYQTFITEDDFAQIAAAGLNWIRLPVGWWMIETWAGEPFLAGVSFKYFLKAIKWARKYGLRVNLDLHAVPGSQNGYNHSGKFGSINFLVGLMGVANAQRTFNYIRTLTQFISQPEYVNVVPMFSVLNEALVQKIGATQIRSFYLQVYQMMRSITGYGQGKGPMMVIHDGFQGPGAGHTSWGGFLKGADRLGLDTHSYFAFDKQSNDSLGYNAYKPCTYWAKSFNQTNADFGFNFAGEYSLAINDCGLWLNNIGVGSRYDGTYPNATAPDLANFPVVGSCDVWKNYRGWSSEVKEHIADLAYASQDAMQNSFFWTWKISPSIRAKDGLKPNPLWDYQLGLQEGWIRPDARRSVGGCAVVAGKEGAVAPVQPWSGEYAEWQVGGDGKSPMTSTIDAAQLALYGQWPPAQITVAQGLDQVYNNVGDLPMYTPTGTVVTLKPEAPDKKDYPASATVGTGGDGWTNDADKGGWYVPIKGCQYPNAWAAGGLPAPTGAFCAGGGNAGAPPPAMTPPPTLRRQH